MKHLSKILTLLFLTTSLCIFSCSSDDSAPVNEDPIVEDPIVEDPIVEDPIVINEFMTAKIDGVPFTATVGFNGSILTSGPTRSLKVEGVSSSGLKITIILRLKPIEEDTYQISLGGGGNVNLINFATSPNLLWSSPYIDSTILDNYGEITITSFTDTEVTGNFEGSLKSDINESFTEVTEGSFNIALN